MKIIFKSTCLIIFLLSFWTLSTQAQNVKIGLIDRQYVSQVLKASNKELLEVAKAEKQLDEEIITYSRTKIQVSVKDSTASFNPTPSSNVEFQQFYNKVSAKKEELNYRKKKVYQSHTDQINLAIEHVAKENGYTLILELQQAPYFSKNDNISELVLKKLGVK